ncbi:hypothetical protein BFP77_02760 [Maribacter sp. 4U21]|uniref:DUF4258 domain-containing protein n=1 Tax=Maribacter sp. 4U21 TaxID=1889779 RepID=UPI000C158229|nr:DUF4258 domain-containing protein [Maribacter sp. 4U21]PIB30994.1 hypothetical protein BFP77_02760 [Maribacter sp. 4U21]
MAFIKRLGFYLFGMSIGLVFLAMFFKKKSAETGVYFCYLPNCRTLKDIRSKPFYYSDEVQTMLANKRIDTLAIRYILTEGDVDFGSSDTKSANCKTYIVEGSYDAKELTLQVKNCKDKATIESIEPTVQ